MGRFDSRVAVVTGGQRGIGLAVAARLCEEGASVVLFDLDEQALAAACARLDASGARAMAVSGSVASAADTARLAEAAIRRYGRIDILVNNVGGSVPGDPVSMSEEAWDAQMALNLKTAFLGCKHVLPVMERQFAEHGKGGAIVNLSSIGCMSFQVEGRVSAAYAASKAGILAFSRSTAIAYVRKGIRVNTVVPGTMHTPLVEHRLVKQLGAQDAQSLIARRHASVPMGRMGDAWDVAHAVLFLASDEAGYITATQLVVDGGMTAARPGA